MLSAALRRAFALSTLTLATLAAWGVVIVPQADDLQVEARVNPQDIDKLQVGEKPSNFSALQN